MTIQSNDWTSLSVAQFVSKILCHICNYRLSTAIQLSIFQACTCMSCYICFRICWRNLGLCLVQYTGGAYHRLDLVRVSVLASDASRLRFCALSLGGTSLLIFPRCLMCVEQLEVRMIDDLHSDTVKACGQEERLVVRLGSVCVSRSPETTTINRI